MNLNTATNADIQFAASLLKCAEVDMRSARADAKRRNGIGAVMIPKDQTIVGFVSLSYDPARKTYRVERPNPKGDDTIVIGEGPARVVAPVLAGIYVVTA